MNLKLKRPIVFFDLETTGVDTATDRIVEISLVKIDVNKLQASRMAAAAAAGQGEKSTTAPIKVDKSVGRNDPCPCGSGKKYKHCHGKL